MEVSQAAFSSTVDEREVARQIDPCERAAAAVREYYYDLNGRVPGKYSLVEFHDFVKKIFKGLGKLYSQCKLEAVFARQRGTPIKAVMDIENYTDVMLWALWLSQ